MGKSHLKIYTILLISNLCSIAIGQIFVKFQDQCACEQLLYENECKANPICNYSNDRCQTIECSLLPVKNCGYNKNCALVNNTCVDFKSCGSHNATTEEACDKLNHNCYFDDDDRICGNPQPFDLGTCSQDLFSICLIANEGLCVRKNGVCKEMTVCEEAAYNSLQCLAAFPACEMGDEICVSHLKCSQSEWLGCAIAKEKINGDRYQLCMRGISGCVNFDPSQQTKESCWKNSSSFYHWDGQECSRCNWASIIKSVLFVALLILGI
ncbi:unnamed protein product [Paramecium octaurelia]|uniref:Uncharacterized protein n=1 Tax=Paramecium octaurelia TaxID=43137 RepID=A0A8S1UGT9_PAROT|nr:unnamed protein product [Paramecium octaurelia]